jgi:spore maturation protein CgeB
VRCVFFVHSLVSCWNHGNAHFLRGVVTELLDRGHTVRVFEPRDGWSRANLVRECGRRPLRTYERAFPHLRSETYDLKTLDLDAALDHADLVVVHEWNEPELVARIGARRAAGAPVRALFHDTHHRSVTAPHEMRRFDLSGYDGVLAYGGMIRRIYLDREWAARAWTWHEAADTRVFRPLRDVEPRADLAWVGNWGDGERTEELRRFVLRPARALGLTGTMHGVRYPRRSRGEIADAGLTYGGWIANFAVPRLFAEHRVTVHVPRRPYVRALPGIPTIRPYEALACGIPLVSAPWDDVEGLFRPGVDFLVARDGHEMKRHLRAVLADPQLAATLAANGLETIRARHTCAHRVDELLAVCAELGLVVREELAA